MYCTSCNQECSSYTISADELNETSNGLYFEGIELSDCCDAEVADSQEMPDDYRELDFDLDSKDFDEVDDRFSQGIWWRQNGD